MTATFGKLEHETLRLEPGLNIIERPNEWGKSTWCAFLTAMLYGVETRSHTTKTALADKERYAPWSGSPMSGQLELNWQGRDITLQRRSKGRIPMGDFSAFETKTGLPVPELTADNCGQLLLGVEKAVFLRSAFLRGSDLAVEPEESLRRRLNALVTAGDEASAADELEGKLRELKNRCRANRSSGLLPQAYGRREELKQNIQTLESLERESGRMERQTGMLKDRLDGLERHRQALDYQAGLEEGRKYAQAAAELEEATRKEKQCRETAQALPPREQLQQKLRQYEQLCLRARQWDGPRSLRYRRFRLWGWLLTGLGAVLAAGGGALLWAGVQWLHWLLWTGGAGCLIAGTGLLYAAGRLRSRLESDLKALAELSGGLDPEEYRRQLLGNLESHARWEEAAAGLEAARQRLAERKQGHPEPSEELCRATQQHREARQQLRQLQLRLGECRGQMAALGDRATLERELEALDGRIVRLEDTYAALQLAQDTLAQARAELQRRFAPQIVKRTQELFSLLTGGRYDQLAMEADLRLHIRASGEDTLRPSLWRSEGTVDQLYLALRLAVAEALVPGSPLILDDALVRFDDERLELALELLEKEARTGQILLFTCQSRENTIYGRKQGTR